MQPRLSELAGRPEHCYRELALAYSPELLERLKYLRPPALDVAMVAPAADERGAGCLEVLGRLVTREGQPGRYARLILVGRDRAEFRETLDWLTEHATPLLEQWRVFTTVIADPDLGEEAVYEALGRAEPVRLNNAPPEAVDHFGRLPMQPSNPALLEAVRSRGVLCDVIPVAILNDLTGVPDRIRCNLPGESGGFVYAGFWIHAGRGLQFLGLWSGYTYHVPNAHLLADVGQRLWRRCMDEKTGTPWDLPDDLKQEYGLEQWEDFVVFSRSECDSYEQILSRDLPPQFTARDLVDTLRPVLTRCERNAAGLIDLQLGPAAATTRLGDTEDDAVVSFTILVHGGFPGRPESLRFLRTIADVLNADLFDRPWGNRVHFDDPYYTCTDDDTRPDEPGNTCPSNCDPAGGCCLPGGGDLPRDQFPKPPEERDENHDSPPES